MLTNENHQIGKQSMANKEGEEVCGCASTQARWLSLTARVTSFAANPGSTGAAPAAMLTVAYKTESMVALVCEN
jgi:hypothetical protein